MRAAFSQRTQRDPRSFKSITESVSHGEKRRIFLPLRMRLLRPGLYLTQLRKVNFAATDVCRAVEKGEAASRLKKHLKKLKVKSLSAFSRLCNGAPDMKSWKNLKCNLFRVHFHCKSVVSLLEIVYSRM